uniref:Putative secreted protein n=1 Tax=Amblyomma triste TaxID=251400 RepID=A0A023G4A2_AMBTT
MVSAVLLSLDLLLLFAAAAEAGIGVSFPFFQEPSDLDIQNRHRRCLQSCHPRMPLPRCPTGCICHPLASNHEIGMCFNPRLQLPQGWDPPLKSSPMSPVTRSPSAWRRYRNLFAQ